MEFEILRRNLGWVNRRRFIRGSPLSGSAIDGPGLVEGVTPEKARSGGSRPSRFVYVTSRLKRSRDASTDSHFFATGTKSDRLSSSWTHGISDA